MCTAPKRALPPEIVSSSVLVNEHTGPEESTDNHRVCGANRTSIPVSVEGRPMRRRGEESNPTSSSMPFAHITSYWVRAAVAVARDRPADDTPESESRGVKVNELTLISGQTNVVAVWHPVSLHHTPQIASFRAADYRFPADFTHFSLRTPAERRYSHV